VTEHDLFDYQQEFMDGLSSCGNPARALLFFRTGAGKSYTAMLGVRELGCKSVLVIAPPATHDAWTELGSDMGVQVTTMSHAKFRRSETKVSRTQAVIADEFHLFGGHKGQGWKKLDTLSRHLQAPMFLLSATPNYNDIERCYCAAHILSPQDAHGGYLQFLYTHCETEQNPFGMEPIVTGFKNHKDAAHFLSSMDKVFYVKDDTVINIVDVPYAWTLPQEFTRFSYNEREHRIMASQMEQRWARRKQELVEADGVVLHDHIIDLLVDRIDGKTLIFATSAVIAEAAYRSLLLFDVACVTGSVPKKRKLELIEEFRSGSLAILIGTATLATGTDGLDKVCDRLIILDDTDDDALRRQLIGRIMPRGEATSTAAKKIFRLVPS
jgi:superfamily II DNA or RNA helicase